MEEIDNLGKAPRKRTKKRATLHGADDKSAKDKGKDKKAKKGFSNLANTKTMAKSGTGSLVDVGAGLAGAFLGARVGKWGFIPGGVAIFAGHQAEAHWLRSFGVGTVAGAITKVAFVDSAPALNGDPAQASTEPEKWDSKKEVERLKNQGGQFLKAAKLMLMPWSKPEAPAAQTTEQKPVSGVDMSSLDNLLIEQQNQATDFFDQLDSNQQREILKGNRPLAPFESQPNPPDVPRYSMNGMFAGG